MAVDEVVKDDEEEEKEEEEDIDELLKDPFASATPTPSQHDAPQEEPR